MRADPLDRAELAANGIAAGRLRDLGEPARPGELMVVADRPATGAAAGPRCAAVATRQARWLGLEPAVERQGFA